MKLNPATTLGVLLLCCSLAAVSHGDTTPPVETEKIQMSPRERSGAHYIPVKNVRPGLMAWWLDPENQPFPAEYRDSEQAYPAWVASEAFARSLQARPGIVSLMGGVDKIIAVDSQNVLLIYGSEEGVRKAETIIGYLDKAPRRLELQAHLVEVSETDLRQFGVDFNDAGISPKQAPRSGTFAFGRVRGNFSATLNALVTNKRAREIKAPRIDAYQNIPVNIDFDAVDISPRAGSETKNSIDILLSILPTINRDGTISLRLNPEANWARKGGLSSLAAPVDLEASTTLNLRDGDAVAVVLTESTLRQSSASRIPILRSNPGKSIVVFVQAYIVHRAEDSIPAPAGAPRADAAKPEKPRPETHVNLAIPVRNVRPSVMAYWLDPANHAVPTEYQLEEKEKPSAAGKFVNPYTAAPSASNQSRFGAGKTAVGTFGLPEGAERIIAIDSQNVLLVYGTEQGVNELKALVNYLDRPQQLVELTTRYVEVAAGSANDFGIDFNSANGPFSSRSHGLSAANGTFSLGFMRKTPAEFQAVLDRLVDQGKANQLGMHQLLTPNNIAASASMRTITAAGTGNNSPQPISIDTRITPTINADGSITLLMKPALESGNSELQVVYTVANVRNGDTIALGGLKPGSQSNNDLLLFVTARIKSAPKSQQQ